MLTWLSFPALECLFTAASLNKIPAPVGKPRCEQLGTAALDTNGWVLCSPQRAHRTEQKFLILFVSKFKMATSKTWLDCQNFGLGLIP